ncbi:hypothetical protein MASR2M66_19920 [Chloroflexota bacterium]
MEHPLEFIPRNARKALFLFFLIFALGIFGVFSFLDAPLKTSAAPNGIVSFELAYTPEKSQSILNSWDENARLFAAFGLGLDYLFMPVYTLALSLGLLLAGYEKAKPYHTLTVWAAWGAFAAALFDAVENYALWNILQGSMVGVLPQLAGICATVKFALLLLGVLIALVGQFVKKV